MSATTVLLTLPGDVVRHALWSMVIVAPSFVTAPGLAVSGAALDRYREAVEELAHEGEPQPCLRCSKKNHEARWRGYPVLDPGPCPPGGVIDDLLEVCECCFWGPSADPLYDRLQREAFDGRDIHVEHLDRDTGRWARFETRF